MPTVRAQIRLPRTGGVPEDDVVNVLHFRTLDVLGATLDHIRDRISAFYNAVEGSLATTLSGAGAIKFYDLGAAMPRPVLGTRDFAFQPAAGNTPMPAELAVAITMVGDPATPGSGPIQYRRGRMYVGPFSASGTLEVVGSDSRPSAALRTTLATAFETLAGGAAVEDPDLCVYSETWHLGRGVTSGGAAGGRGPLPALPAHSLESASTRVISGWIDNAWDVQRRRGADATARTNFTVVVP